MKFFPCAALFVACALATAPPARTQWMLDNAGKSGVDMLTYRGNGLSFKYPNAWKRADKPRALHLTSGQSGIVLYITEGVHGSDALLVSYSKRLRGQSRGYVTEKRSMATLDGHSAQLLQFRAVSPAGVPSKGRIACMVVENRGIVFVLTSPATSYDGANAVFSNLLHSLAFAAAPTVPSAPTPVVEESAGTEVPTASPTSPAVEAPVSIEETPPPAAGPAAISALLPDGAEVKIAMTRKIDSRSVKTGEKLQFKVVEDVFGADGKAIILRDQTALGRVDYARGPKAFGVPGKLRVAVESTLAADGTRVPLRGEQYRRGAGNATVTVLFMPFGGFWMKGKNPAIEEGAILKAYVDWPDGDDESGKTANDGAKPVTPTKAAQTTDQSAPARIPTR